MMTKQKSTALAKALVKKLKGRGWKYDVWENLGWCFSASNGPLSVHPDYGSGGRDAGKVTGYWCLVSPDIKKVGGGLAAWRSQKDNPYYRNPNNAVTAASESAKAYVERLAPSANYWDKLLEKDKGATWPRTKKTSVRTRSH